MKSAVIALERDLTAAVCNVTSFCELVLWKFEKHPKCAKFTLVLPPDRMILCHSSWCT